MLSFTIAQITRRSLACGARTPIASGPTRAGTMRIFFPRAGGGGPIELTMFAVLGGIAPARGWRSSPSPSCTSNVAWQGITWCCSASGLRRHTATPGLGSSPRQEGWRSQPVVEHEAEYDSVLVAFEVGPFEPGRPWRRGQARRAAPARIHVLVSIVVPGVGEDRRAHGGQGARSAGDIEQAKLMGGGRVTGSEKGGRGQAGARSRRGQEMRARAIVMTLAPRSGGTLFDPNGGDGGRAPLPGQSSSRRGLGAPLDKFAASREA